MMKGINTVLFALLAVSLAGRACAARRVLFIGFDGLSSVALRQGAEMPEFRKLMKEGTSTLSNRAILPSSSACNWASIFACTSPELNGFVEWDTRAPVVPPAVVGENGLVPDIFSVLRKQRPSDKIGYAYQWPGMAYVANTNSCDFVRVVSNKAAMDSVLEFIRTQKPDLMVFVNGGPDGTGHKFGWCSPEYMNAAKDADHTIPALIGAYRAAGILDDTIVVISSDHGGKDKRHGGATLDEMEKPLVFWGKGIVAGREIKSSTASYDIGATMAYFLGIRPPQVWIGRPIPELTYKKKSR